MFTDTPPESICIVRLSAIGDTCHVLAVVRCIQDSWPETRITWIIGKIEASLLNDVPNVEFIIFDKSAGISEYRKIRARLAMRRFDVALCMHPSMRANFILPLIKSPHKIGFDRGRAKDQQWLFTNRRIPPGERLHVLDSLFQFIETIGINRRALRWDIPIAAAHSDFAAQYRSDDQPVFLISPCSSQRARNFRNWSAENYAAAANHARQKFNCKIILTGASTDQDIEYGNTISKRCGPGLINLIGKTSLKQLLALIDMASVVLCPDSGPAHIATATGTPVIGLYASNNPERTGPYLNRHLVVNVYPQAVNKFLSKTLDQVRFGERVRNPAAMSLIRLGAVNAKIDKAFSEIA